MLGPSERRRRDFELGRIDYTGRDRFDNIANFLDMQLANVDGGEAVEEEE